jgi:hypothetical protein
MRIDGVEHIQVQADYAIADVIGAAVSGTWWRAETVARGACLARYKIRREDTGGEDCQRDNSREEIEIHVEHMVRLLL